VEHRLCHQYRDLLHAGAPTLFADLVLE
jgi:hypothetical protein